MISIITSTNTISSSQTPDFIFKNFMAAFNRFFLMVIFAALLVKKGLSYEAPGPSDEYSTWPLTTYDEQVNACVAELHHKCLNQIFFATFYDKGTVSEQCCFNLVHGMRKPCHVLWTNYVLRAPQFKHKELEIRKRAIHIWLECVHQ